MKATQENVEDFVDAQPIVKWKVEEGEYQGKWQVLFILEESNAVFALTLWDGCMFKYYTLENCSFFIGEDECSVELQWADIYYEFVQTFKELGYVGK